MKPLVKWAAALIALGVIGTAVWFGVERYRYRFVRTDADLIKLLPPGDLTTFYVNVAALRQGGLLHLLTGITPAAENDYRDFVAATQFDYARDIDALAGGLNGEGGLFFLIRGRWNWEKLRQFTIGHGGKCNEEACRVAGTKRNRWINFLRIQPDTVGLAITENPTAADLLRPPARRLQDDPPSNDPVWVNVSQALIKDPTILPKAMQIFTISLQPAASVLLSARQPEHPNEAFSVQLEANFPNAPGADTTCKQLQLQTKMFRLALAHENRQPDPADLTGLLAAGKFQVGDTHVFGTWPVRKELLKAME